MSTPQTMTGAIALVKVKGQYVGKIKNISWTENYRRLSVKGCGTIFSSEDPVVDFAGTCSVNLIEVDFKSGGLPDAIKRKIGVIRSQVLSGNPSFEDNLVLDQDGVQLDVYKKEEDLIDPTTGDIIPKATPFAIIKRAFITMDRFEVSEGALASRSKTFNYLDAVVYP